MSDDGGWGFDPFDRCPRRIAVDQELPPTGIAKPEAEQSSRTSRALIVAVAALVLVGLAALQRFSSSTLAVSRPSTSPANGSRTLSRSA